MWKEFGLVNPQGTLPKCQISRRHMRGSTLHTMWDMPTSRQYRRGTTLHTMWAMPTSRQHMRGTTQHTMRDMPTSRQYMRGTTLHTMWDTPTSHSHVSEIIRGECMSAPDMPKPRSSPHSPNQLFIIVIDLLMA